MAGPEALARSMLDKKHAIITLQWLVVIVTSTLLLFSGGKLSEDPWVYGLILIFFLSALILQRLPEAAFYDPFFDTGLALLDTLLISASIYMNRSVPWDLFLFYFFILFLAAIGENMVRIVIGSVLISIIYVVILVQQGKGLAQMGPDLFIRIPFLFGAAILYGYLSENAKREKARAETAEQRERLKMDLVAALAHDIKSPLGVIMGYSELVRDQLGRLSGGRGNLENLERIQDNVQRIVNLVTGFLEASKAEAGKLEIVHRPVSVNRLLQEVARNHGSDLTKKNLTLVLALDEKLLEVLGDEAQLSRVFWNLIGNAIKFTPAGGKITASSRLEDGHVSVAIRDNGIGIPDEELPILFAQFRRLKGAAKIEGTGLGLFIVKTIVEAHKGTVRAESADGQGSTFTVRIPARARQETR